MEVQVPRACSCELFVTVKSSDPWPPGSAVSPSALSSALQNVLTREMLTSGCLYLVATHLVTSAGISNSGTIAHFTPSNLSAHRVRRAATSFGLTSSCKG
jgi:hypothetical protein